MKRTKLAIFIKAVAAVTFIGIALLSAALSIHGSPWWLLLGLVAAVVGCPFIDELVRIYNYQRFKKRHTTP